MFASLFRYSDQILFYHEDGAGVGDVDAKAETRTSTLASKSPRRRWLLGLLGKLADEMKAGRNSCHCGPLQVL